MPGRIQSITFRLHDAVPETLVTRWREELNWLEGLPATDPREVELRERLTKYEDAGHGACWLRDDRIAHIVQDALLHFDGERYRLIAWCIMPNHVHTLIETLPGPPRTAGVPPAVPPPGTAGVPPAQPSPGTAGVPPASSPYSLSSIVHSWKSFTAHEANKLLGRHGDFWFREYHDRYIRGRRHFDACRDYIESNPVEAGLAGSPEAWRWSSAMVQKGRTAGGTPAVPGVAEDLGDSAGGTPAVPAVAEDLEDRAGGTPAVPGVARDFRDSAAGG